MRCGEGSKVLLFLTKPSIAQFGWRGWRVVPGLTAGSAGVFQGRQESQDRSMPKHQPAHALLRQGRGRIMRMMSPEKSSRHQRAGGQRIRHNPSAGRFLLNILPSFQDASPSLLSIEHCIVNNRKQRIFQHSGRVFRQITKVPSRD